jgi:hypothetical protein
MIKKILLTLVFLTQLSIMPSWSAENVLIDRVTQSEAEELDIQIPEDTAPGFHEVRIEVSDDAGIVSEKTLFFCKNLAGEIKWDNDCPDLATVVINENGFASYDPASEPGKTQSTQIAAFALLAALSAGGAAAAGGSSNSKDSSGDRDGESREDLEESEDSEDLSSVSSGELKLIQRDPGRGDLSGTWEHRFTEKVDTGFVSASENIARFSPLLARILGDGSYLRAIFGSFSLVMAPLGALMGLLALLDVGAESLPPATWIVIAIAVLGTLDATAGFIATIVFINGVVMNGNIFSRSEFLTACGLSIIFFAPALLASAIRPVRRLINSGDDRWERITDYALVGLLSFWTMEKVVGALNGLSGLRLPVTDDAKVIALWVAGFVMLRVILEDLATYNYPVRLEVVTPEIKSPSKYQQILSLEFKTFTFVMLAMPFVGFNIQLLVGTMFFLIPAIAGLTFSDNLPKFPVLSRLLPKGAFKIVAMVFIGSFFANWVESLFENPKDFIAWSFALLAIPGLILKFAGDMARKPKRDWRTTVFGRAIYRILGVVVYLVIIQIVRGVDITTWL